MSGILLGVVIALAWNIAVSLIFRRYKQHEYLAVMSALALPPVAVSLVTIILNLTATPLWALSLGGTAFIIGVGYVLAFSRLKPRFDAGATFRP